MLRNSEAPGALAIVTKAGHSRNSASSNFTVYVIYLQVEKLPQLESTTKTKCTTNSIFADSEVNP